MARHRAQPPDDPSSAPDSGTVRDDTSGNNPPASHDRPLPFKPASDLGEEPPDGPGSGEDASIAGEER